VSLLDALRSRRTLAVSVLSFASGLPLGLVWYAIPDWMRGAGVDIRLVGLLTLAQAPWSFKVLWSPLMDRYVPPFWGRRRGWMAVTQLVLGVLVLMLAGLGERPETLWIVGALTFAIAIASASQDIAIDAYAVEVLRREEQGAAVGARLAFYRAAMLVSGGVSITLAARIGWPAVNGLLAIVFVLMLALTWRSPEPDMQPTPPPTLRDAVSGSRDDHEVHQWGVVAETAAAAALWDFDSWDVLVTRHVQLARDAIDRCRCDRSGVHVEPHARTLGEQPGPPTIVG